MPIQFESDLKANFKYNVPLSQYTTFRLGGNCPCLISCQTPEELESVIKRVVGERLPFILIGGGSNLVVSDHSVECVVIRYVTDRPMIERQGNDLTVSGSTSLDDLAKFAIEEGREGLNTCHGIPGTVGGAVVGNAGAFGKQVGDVLKTAILISQQGVKRKVSASELGFTYRNSNLKQTSDIVLSVTFALRLGNKKELRKQRDEILKLRHEKHPDLQAYPCAGSFFRNIEPTSKAEKRQATGWFLEQAGGKNLRAGGAVIYDKHANIIVKSDGCRAQDVYELSLKMAQLAKQAFDLNLEREVRFVGKFDGVQLDKKNIIWQELPANLVHLDLLRFIF